MRAVLAFAPLRALGCLSRSVCSVRHCFGVAPVVAPALAGLSPLSFLLRKFDALLKDCTLFALRMSLIFSNFAV